MKKMTQGTSQQENNKLEAVAKIKQYRANTGSDLTDTEIQRWVENMVWVERFMERYERKKR